MTTAETAFKLATAGFWVIPVRANKIPYGENGLKDCTNDPYFAKEWMERTKAPHVGIVTGPSGIVVLDLDYAEDEDGNVIKDGFESLAQEWLEVPESFEYVSLNGHGKHIMYAAPEGVNLARSSNYRKMYGVDRQSGESYVVYPSDVIPDKAALAPAPEWLLDPSEVRTAAIFEGDVKEWYDTLEPGEPNLIVRAAMDRAKALFESNGEDFSHSDIVEKQHEAVRLGAEGHPGVPALIALLEELTLTRTGSHSRTPEEYQHEFHEALASGIKKHGAAIALRSELPEYNIAMVPTNVKDSLISGAPGDRPVFRDLLRELQAGTTDDLVVTSVLWNSPRTRDISREWGLEFVHQRVLDARSNPEPVRENPTLPAPEPTKDSEPVEKTAILSKREAKIVAETPNFIKTYIEASQKKGFTNLTYADACAWTVLSMAFGRKAFIPLSKTLEVNLWFIVLGESTTGKGTEDSFLRNVLNTMFIDDESENYNLGALSSPDGLHISLVNRDGKPSIIHNDEAADFFHAIREKAWMVPVPDHLSKWFDGFVEPSSKISLKEAKGKSARTSLNQLMWGTPDRLLSLLDASQFGSGYLARVNWVWDGTIPDPNRKSDLRTQRNRVREVPDSLYDVAADALHAASLHERSAVVGTPEAEERINQAIDAIRKESRKSPREEFFRPAVDRLTMEILWKCAALTALYQGRTEFSETDALIAISFAEKWLRNMMKVAESISESPYSRDVEEMETFIRSEGGTVSRSSFLHHFRGKIVKSARELEDRITFLLESGRVLRVDENRAIHYKING